MVDPLATARSLGANVTSGYRDAARNRRVGGVPGSDHLNADAIDLTPGKGQSWGDLHAMASEVAKARGGKVVDESRTKKPHIHLSLPGWGQAPGLPAPPSGFVPIATPPATAPANFGTPSGAVHDGDTFGLTSGRNARLYGVDAFELNQQGRSPQGQPVPLGINARDALVPFATPDGRVTATGGTTYGRPVVSLDNDGDAGQSLLRSGNALAAPDFLRGDPRLGQYMEAERLARLNRLGAHGNTYQTPQAERAGLPDPWEKPEASTDGKGTAFFWDEPTPFQGLRPEIADGYLGVLNAKDSTADDVMTFAATNGFSIERRDVEKFLDRKAKGYRSDNRVNYVRPPRVLTDPGDGKFGTVARGIADPINMLDEMGAVVDSVGLTSGRENVWGSDRRFGDILANNLDQNRSILAHDEESAPYYRLGGQIASGVVLPFGGGIRTVGGLARLGAVEGGLAGFGAGEGNIGQRLPNAVVGAGMGAVGGAALGKASDLVGAAWRARQSAAAARRGFDAADDGSNAVREAAYEAAPIVEDGAQNIGPTPAARSQGQGGVISSAAMRMEDGGQSLLGPSARSIDRIDVANIPPPPAGFVEEAAGAMRRVDDAGRLMDVADASQRLNPEDMLSVADGAPDEFAALETREFAKSGARSTYQRGPVDLVGFVRSQGGLQDQAGELSHLGITNAARDMDFAKGEGFLGGLVREDGHNLDDMAEKAWEAGYFRERPTVPEFLDALADTHSGAQRVFHPGDLGEVAQHEAERGQRFAMESAGQDEDNILRVANVDVSRIETPQDIRHAMASIQEAIGSNPARKPISHEATAELAEQIGLTPADFLKRRRGQPLNHAEAYALRELHAASLNETVNRARKAIGGSDLERANFLKSVAQSAALQDHIVDAAAETGRALSQYRMIAKASARSADAVKAIIDGKGGHDTIDKMAQALIELEQDPAQAGRFIQKMVKPGFKDMFNEYYINNLVSGLKTHSVNIVSNLVTAGLQLPEHALAAGVGGIRSALTRSTDKVYFSELGPRLTGMLQGARTGLANARIALKTGRASDDTHKVESRFQHAIPGRLGHVVRIPTRMLTAEDEFFKGMALGSDLAGSAVRRARAEGLRGEALSARIAELNANPSDEALRAAKDYARYVTFQRQLGPLGMRASQLSNEVPGLKIIIPFVRTPTNLLKFAVERSPAAPLLKEWRADMMAGGARRDLAMVRATSGTALGALAASWAAQGIVTGGGPADDNARRILMADGWQPYSIKIGGKYYSYARLDPLATTLGMAADYVDKSGKMTERQADEQAMTLTASIIQNLENKVWLSGMADFAQAVDDPERYGPAYVRRTLATLAVPVGVNQVAQTFDPVPREAKTIGEQVQSRIPGLSDDLRPRLDAWGRPILKEGGLGPDIVSPVYRSTRRHEGENNEALRLGLKVSDPSRIVAGRRLSDGEFHAYRMQAGTMMRDGLGQAMASPSWKGLSDDQRRKAFDKIKRDARKIAREGMGLAHGDDGQEVAIPPPPPGFMPQ